MNLKRFLSILMLLIEKKKIKVKYKVSSQKILNIIKINNKMVNSLLMKLVKLVQWSNLWNSRTLLKEKRKDDFLINNFQVQKVLNLNLKILLTIIIWRMMFKLIFLSCFFIKSNFSNIVFFFFLRSVHQFVFFMVAKYSIIYYFFQAILTFQKSLTNLKLLFLA